MLRIFTLFLFLFPLVYASKILSTSYGKVRGSTLASDDGNHKYLFKSLPFAKPPIGDLRFALPQDPNPWDGVLDATNYSAACMSNFTTTRNEQKKISEDCLYLNVFTSRKCLTQNCQVLVYIHGGAFRAESAVMFSDDFILERYVSEDLVFVTIPYRLGVFGQLYFGPKTIVKENVLVYDVIKALEFVHNEISNFGGDPDRVTLMGHSAGACLAQLIGVSELIDPKKKLFQQMITFSVTTQFPFYDSAIDHSYELAEKVGCSPVNDRHKANVPDILSCLRKLNSTEILKAQSEMVLKDVTSFVGPIKGAPMIKSDGKFSEFLKNATPRNMICGTSEKEFSVEPYKYPVSGMFWDVDNPKEVIDYYYKNMPRHEPNWVDMNTAGIFISSGLYCAQMANSGANAYIFETRQKPESMHVTDMQYFIGIHREGVHTKDMDILDSFYSKMLVNFTKFGEPSPDWEKLDTKRMNYLELKVNSELGEGPKMMEKFHEKEMRIWFGNVMEYDKNVTMMKRDLENSITGRIPTRNPIFSNPKSSEVLSFFDQWWSYLIIFLALTTVAMVIVTVRKTVEGEEEVPLLS